MSSSSIFTSQYPLMELSVKSILEFLKELIHLSILKMLKESRLVSTLDFMYSIQIINDPFFIDANMMSVVYSYVAGLMVFCWSLFEIPTRLKPRTSDFARYGAECNSAGLVFRWMRCFSTSICRRWPSHISATTLNISKNSYRYLG